MQVIPDTIIGLHEPGGESHFDPQMRGWITFTHEVGHDANVHTGFDYRPWSKNGIGSISRLNNGYGSAGTIPKPQYYSAFAVRVANFVNASPGIQIVIIGNEPNHSSERPDGDMITAEMYVTCFKQCYTAIKHANPNVLVLPAPIAPWNMESGDWLAYQGEIISQIQALGMLDGGALHAYTHDHDPYQVSSTERKHGWYWEFYTYLDQMCNFPEGIPFFITEANPQNGWKAVDNGWIREVYHEITAWNIAQPKRQIYCCNLYRWPNVHDQPQWIISTRPNVIADFDSAVEMGFPREVGGTMPEEEWAVIHRNSCENGFYQQGGVPQLTVPVGTTIHWIQRAEGDPVDIFRRPEAALKDAEKHPEVYEGRYSCGAFYISSIGRYGFVLDRVYVQNGRAVRGSAMYMHVHHSKSEVGSRCGMIDGDGPFGDGGPEWPSSGVDPFQDNRIVWGGWASTYGGVPDREWVKLETPQVVPSEGYVRMVVQFNCDFADFGAGHYDVFLVEQLTDGSGPVEPPTPVEGGYKVELTVTGTIVPM